MPQALRVLLAAAYPVIIYIALQHYEPRQVVLVLLMLVAARLFIRPAGDDGQPAAWRWGATAGLLALAALVALSNSETLLRLYPVLMNLAMLGVFAYSLLHPPTVVERIARLREPDLPPEAVAYTRQVTLVWCGFFIVNGAISAYTALLASRETWAWYNGGVAYVLMGLLFAGEWLVRRRVRGGRA